VVLCSPGNPTGVVVGREDLARISEPAAPAGACAWRTGVDDLARGLAIIAEVLKGVTRGDEM
jgi:hypothetical protein